VFLAGIWPAYADYLDDRARSDGPVALAAPQGAAGWVTDTQAMTNWRPRYRGADASVFQVYRKGDRQVALYLGYYHNQRQGSELINSTNLLVVQKHPVWSDIGSRRSAETMADQKVDVRETRLSSSAQRLLAWEWFAISGTYLTNPYVGKLLLARDKLLGRGDDGLAIILATPYEEGKAGADETLREFVRDMLPGIAATAKPLSK
jgi:EpsI family protein